MKPKDGAPGATADRGRLDEEISLLRQAIRRLFALSLEQDSSEAVKTLSALGVTAAKLGFLLQTQARLKEMTASELDAQLMRALEEVAKEFQL